MEISLKGAVAAFVYGDLSADNLLATYFRTFMMDDAPDGAPVNDPFAVSVRAVLSGFPLNSPFSEEELRSMLKGTLRAPTAIMPWLSVATSTRADFAICEWFVDARGNASV